MKLRSPNEELTVLFMYERLPNFCYQCGILGHLLKDCPLSLNVGSNAEIESLQYGAWLRESWSVRQWFTSGSSAQSFGEQGLFRGRVRLSLRRGAGIFDFTRRSDVGGSRISSPERVGELSPIAVEQEAIGGVRDGEQFCSSRLDGRDRDKGKWLAHELSEVGLVQSPQLHPMHAGPLLAESSFSPLIYHLVLAHQAILKFLQHASPLPTHL
ncbi:hypothetical protein Salat_1801100 [Sesamum alatum]|uniref:CCHC-type domain-containing protein n=1 Tax=Sesamum alatum TaxID=300844 RepID=A0AAE1Y322_9LAMI|nr:hypothetical protein Salat_1801100 [Sesamum alatum]